MPNSLTWYSWVDQSLPDCSTAQNQAKSVLWALKAALKGEITGPTLGPAGAVPSGARWTVYQSCDSTAAGSANDGVDRWGGGTFDATKLVRASPGAHSWMVLKSPSAVGPLYLTLDWLSTSDSQGVFVLSKTAPTGGTTSLRPTAVDETVLAVSQFVDTSAWTNGRCHFTTTANGEFWFLCSKNSAGLIPTAFGVQTLNNLRQAGDTWPVVLVAEGVSGANALREAANRFYRGSTTSSMRAWYWNGSGASGVQATCLSYNAGTGTSFLEDMAGVFIPDSKWETNPCDVYTTTAAAKGLKGRFQDLNAVSSSLATGSRYPATGDVERIVVGSTMVPLTAVPTL